MKKVIFAFSLLFFCFVSVNFAQEQSVGKRFDFKGIVKNQSSTVFAGIPLFFKNGEKEDFTSTDINGEFHIQLLPGNYEVTVRKTLSETFRAYISIQENGLNPSNVEFIIEPNQLCCQTSDQKPYPKILQLPKPPYPAAARAVRATGEVVVEVKIDEDGNVISANAVSGHPLLRASSVQAAKQTLFEAIKSGEQGEAKLTYVYLQTENKTETVKRYSNPYRIEVISTLEIIANTVNTKT